MRSCANRMLLALYLCAAASVSNAQNAEPKAPADFKGKIDLDVRDSKPDWKPFTLKAAPEGAPNVLIVSTASSAEKPTSGFPTWRKTIASSTSPT